MAPAFPQNRFRLSKLARKAAFSKERKKAKAFFSGRKCEIEGQDRDFLAFDDVSGLDWQSKVV